MIRHSAIPLPMKHRGVQDAPEFTLIEILL